MNYTTATLVSMCLLAACMQAPDPSMAGTPQHSAAMPHAQGGPPPSSGGPSGESKCSGGRELAMAVPSNWSEADGGNAFTVARWTIEGGGQCTVTAVGGDIAANFQRWEQQFIIEEALATEDVADSHYAATMATLSGTLTSTQQIGGGAPLEGWMLIGFAIPETPAGPLYVKVLGPKEMLRAQLEEIKSAVAKLEIL